MDNFLCGFHPGSHRWPIYVNEYIGHFSNDYRRNDQSLYEPLWAELMRVHGSQIESFRARKGQALIWSANLLHGGGIHRDPERSRWSQVTHYYFQGCSYYTPMYSDPPTGRVFYREPYNVLSGLAQKNVYNGTEVSQDVLDFANPERSVQYAMLPHDFDPARYLELNLDVKDSGVDAARHYIEWGGGEGRRYR